MKHEKYTIRTWFLALLIALTGLILTSVPAWACSDESVICVDADATGNNNGASWTDAYTDLQTALDNAGSGDEIWVAEGVYYPSTGTNRHLSFGLKDGVAMYGGFAGNETLRTERDWTAHVTVLSGNLGDPDNADDNSEHVVVGSGTTSSTVLDGFTISDGKAYNPSKAGGGIFLSPAGSPTLANLVIRDNVAGYDGGGLYNNGGSPSLTNVAFDNNEAFLYDGGGMYTTNGSPTLENVTFTANNANANGGGLYNDGGDPTLTNVNFQSNLVATDGGGGMYSNSGNPSLDTVTFDSNTADFGGGLGIVGGGPSITNASFVGNEATDGSGGGMSVTLSDFTLADAVFRNNTAASDGGGLLVNMSDVPVLVNVTLRSNTAAKGGGGLGNVSSSTRLVNVILTKNSAANGGGLYNYGGSPTLVNTTFSGNSATNAGGGIYNSKKSGSVINPLQLSNSIVWGNTAPTGLQIHTVMVDEGGEWDEMPMPIIRHSDIEDSGGSGAGWDAALGTDGGGNIDADPLFRNTAAGNLHLLSYSPAVDVGNDALLPADSADLDGDGNTAEPIPHDIDGENRVLYDTVDMGADEVLIRIWYVDDDGDPANGCSSWADACPNLRDVLNQAADGDEVWVAAGTYKPDFFDTRRHLTFKLKDGVGVYGGFAATETDREQRDPAANLSLLSGDLDDSSSLNDSDAYHVVDGSGVDGYTVLDGFTISGGNANGDATADYDHGGGLYILDGSPVLTDLIFSGNFGAGGGGLYAEGNGTPTITDVLFTGNDAQFGGGIYNAAGSLPTLANLTFSGNSATYGGGLYIDRSNPTLTNAAIWNNSVSTAGGGLFVNEGSPTLINVTVSGNSATNYGGGIYNQRSSPTVVNSIVWGNSASTFPAMYNDVESTPTISYSDIQDSGGSGTGWDTGLGTDGGGNLDDDPRLVDATNGDLRLTYHSPAIDAGNSLSVTTSTDLADNPRMMGAAVDMGAYEVEQNTVTVSGSETWLDFGPDVCARVWFTNTGTLPNSIAITLTHEYPSVNLDGLPRRYEIVPTGGSTYEARLQLCYEDDELAQAGIDIVQEPNLHAYRYAGSPTWVEYSTADTVNNTVSAHNVTELGIWGLGVSNNQPTALALRSFTAHRRRSWLPLLPVSLFALLTGARALVSKKEQTSLGLKEH
jgi:predicted outer membrane repeat protein